MSPPRKCPTLKARSLVKLESVNVLVFREIGIIQLDILEMALGDGSLAGTSSFGGQISTAS